MKKISYYRILDVSRDASDDEIVAAFRRKVKQWHPDICDDPDAEERMREINRAAEVLCDPERRKRYDRAMARKEQFEEGPASERKDADHTGVFSSKASWGTSLIRSHIRPESFRFVTAGCIALVILAGLIWAFLMAFPMLSGSPQVSSGIPGGTGANTIPPASPGSSAGVEEADSTVSASGDYRISLPDSVRTEDDSSTEGDLWYNRGMTLLALGMYQEAAESFDRALANDPDNSLVLAEKGAALIGLKRYEESLDYTDRALGQNQEIAWIWNNRGIALENLGQLDEARRAYENAGIVAGSPTGGELYREVVLGSNRVF